MNPLTSELEEHIESGLYTAKTEPVSGDLIIDGDYREEKSDGEMEQSCSLVQATSEEEEDNEVGLNSEELNRKFEEFIRKMKEEIRIRGSKTINCSVT